MMLLNCFQGNDNIKLFKENDDDIIPLKMIIGIISEK